MKRVVTIAAILVLAGVAAVAAYQAAARERDYRTLLARGDAALAADQSFDAIEAYSGAIALRPDSMLAHLRRGETYRALLDLEAAARDFRQASDLDPSATRPLEALGDVLYDRGRFARAAEVYAERLRLDDAGAVPYKVALALYRAGDYASAIAAVTHANRLDDSAAQPHYLLGLALHETGKASEAARAFEKAVALSPGFVEAREELADTYAALDRRADEMEERQMIAGLDRSRPERLVDLALAQARSGQSELAVLTLGQAAERAPNHPTIYAALGRVWLDIAVSRNELLPALERRVALGKAIEALERVATNPEATSEVLTLYGRALLRNDQPEEAERVLQLATTRYPVDPAAFLAYASAAERQAHLDAARRALIEYGALVSDEPDFAARARHIGTLSVRLDDMEAAVPWFERAVVARAGDIGLVADLAGAQIRSGDKAAARATVARALERAPQHPALLDLARRAQ